VPSLDSSSDLSSGDPSLAERQGERVFYTWTAQNKAEPLPIVGGEGARFRTADGALWWDLGSMTWNAALGHGHPRMIAAMTAAASRGLLVYPTAVFPDKARAGELLVEVAPAGASKAFICLSGAEANENAVKMARLYTGRSKIVARTQSYHGATLAMLSLSGDPRRLPFEPGLPGVLRMASPYCYRCPFGLRPIDCGLACADDLETVLRREGPDTVAAVILEGIVGANGVLVPPAGYFRRVRELCDRYGILLIADEVLSGFGRTGRWFAIDHDGVSPDLLTVGKGVTAGYAPGGAVVVSERIARHFDDQTLLCGLTSYAHPLVCAAMVAAIETLRDEHLVERAAALGAWWQPQLQALAAHRPIVGEVRGLGLLWALELVEPASTADADASAPRPPLAPQKTKRLAELLRARHVHLHRRENLFYLAPPLIADQAFLTEATGLLAEALDEVARA